MGATVYDNALRIEFRLTFKAYRNRVQKYGLPWAEPYEWITPHERQKHRGG